MTKNGHIFSKKKQSGVTGGRPMPVSCFVPLQAELENRELSLSCMGGQNN